MKSLCLVLGFTLLLAAACGVTLIGGWRGCAGRRPFRACLYDRAAAAPPQPAMARPFLNPCRELPGGLPLP